MTNKVPEPLIDPIKGVNYRPGIVPEPEAIQVGELEEHGWSYRSWTDGPSTEHSPHDHPYSHRVLCVTGWIEFSVDGSTVRLTTGDALDLPKRVTHSAVSAPDQSTTYWLLRPSQ